MKFREIAFCGVNFTLKGNAHWQPVNTALGIENAYIKEV